MQFVYILFIKLLLCHIKLAGSLNIQKKSEQIIINSK